MPGEAEKAAELMGVPFQEFFEKNLMVDFWYRDNKNSDRDIPILSPAIVGMKSGTEAPAVAAGTCVFFKDGLCSIHAAKPYECSIYDHDVSKEQSSENHKEIMTHWKDQPTDKIVELLGREPEAEQFSFFDALTLLTL